MGIGAIIGLVGIGASIWGASQSASAASSAADANAAAVQQTAAHNASISNYDAQVTYGEAQEAFMKTNTELAQHRIQGDLFLATQKTNYAKSGVAVGTGTPLEVMSRTHDEFMKDQLTILNEGKKQVERSESLAYRFLKLGEYGQRDAAAQAGYIQQAGADRSTGAYLSGAATAATQTYQLGFQQGWWGTG